MIGSILDGLALVLVGGGLLLATIGLYGLLRLDDVLSQLHAAGLITGPSVVLVLVAGLATGSAEIATSTALVALFVLITAPLSSHAIAQVAHRGAAEGRDERTDDRLGQRSRG